MSTLGSEFGERQVPNAWIALCNGTGGVLSSTGGPEHPTDSP